MLKFLIIATTLLASSATFAQGTSSQINNQNSRQMNDAIPATQAQDQKQATAQIANQIRTNLQQAGFKNIRLMPSSFIVRAEDQNNNPVMMVINPDSVTAVSAINQNSPKTTGQASQDGPGNSNNNTGQ